MNFSTVIHKQENIKLVYKIYIIYIDICIYTHFIKATKIFEYIYIIYIYISMMYYILCSYVSNNEESTYLQYHKLNQILKFYIIKIKYDI